MTSNDLLQEFAREVDREALRRMAGKRAYERGLGYFEGGLVGQLAVVDGAIEAEVSGTLVYRSRLWRTGKQLDYSCTCPVGADGAFCKHVVAVGLACLAPGRRIVAKKSGARRREPKVDVRSDLAGRSKEQLIDLLVEQAEEHEPLRRRLQTDAASRPGRRLDLATLRRAIDDATSSDGFVSYYDAYGYAKGIEDVIDAIERLPRAGHSAAAIELVEHALASVEEAMGSVDDSDGHMGPILSRLQDLHLQACTKARPDPRSLARRIFDWELRTDWDTFFDAANTYAKVFGDIGLRVYRERAQAAWSRVPALKPGNARGTDSFTKRFRITRIMETLAMQAGDLEELVAVKERDLSMPYAFLQIAEIYRDAGKRDLALEWAERGLREFKTVQQDGRLREFLANEYHARKRHGEAMALMWDTFAESHELDAYQKLKSHADHDGQWDAWRGRAITFLRQRANNAPPRARDRQSFAGHLDRSTLVRIFLWEKDVEAAWAEAKVGDCSDDLWLKLAALREGEHPGDVLPVYQRQVENAVSRANNEAYREAVGLMRKVRKLMLALGSDAEFPTYLEKVRAMHRAKRNFVKLLDHARWT